MTTWGSKKLRWISMAYIMLWLSPVCLVRTVQETYFSGSEYELNIYLVIRHNG